MAELKEYKEEGERRMLSCFVLEQGWDGLREKFLCDYRTFDFLCEVHGLLKVSTVYRSFKVFVLK